METDVGGRTPPSCKPHGHLALAAGLGLALVAAPATAQTSGGATSSGSATSAGSTTSGGSTAATGPRVSALRYGGLGLPVGTDTLLVSDPVRAWTIRPSISVDLMATDNVFLTARDRRSDLITSVAPSIVASANTARLQGVFSYSPRAYFYASTDGQDRLDHFLNAQALATLVEERLFFDMRANAGVQSLTGGVAPGTTSVVDRRNRVQTTSVRLSPYLQNRFGGLGTLQVGYAFQYVDQSTGSGLGGGGDGGSLAGGLGSSSFFTPGDFTSHEGYATFRTGEDLGRYAAVARVSATEYDGTGVLDGASRRIGLVENSYAITNGIAALVDLGYEQQRYAGPRPYELDSAIWALGVRLTGPDSSITAKYGRREGFESGFLDASVALGARTRLAARYEERVTTTRQFAADRLATAQLDPSGNPVDPVTGTPLLGAGSDSLLAVQGGLLRWKTGSVSISQTWPRDLVTVSLIRDERAPVNAAPGSTVFSQEAISGSLTWVRDLTPELTATAYLQYGVTETRGRGDQDFFTGGLSLSRALGQGLYGTMQYRLTNRDDYSGSGRAIQNLVLVGLRKDFW
jgi:uncharacterized protein (PEP-CTERM system associated)